VHAEGGVGFGGDGLADVAEADDAEDVAAGVVGDGRGVEVAVGEGGGRGGGGDAPGEVAEGGEDAEEGEVCDGLGGGEGGVAVDDSWGWSVVRLWGMSYLSGARGGRRMQVEEEDREGERRREEKGRSEKSKRKKERKTHPSPQVHPHRPSRSPRPHSQRPSHCLAETLSTPYPSVPSLLQLTRMDEKWPRNRPIVSPSGLG